MRDPREGATHAQETLGSAKRRGSFLAYRPGGDSSAKYHGWENDAAGDDRPRIIIAAQ